MISPPPLGASGSRQDLGLRPCRLGHSDKGVPAPDPPPCLDGSTSELGVPQPLPITTPETWANPVSGLAIPVPLIARGEFRTCALPTSPTYLKSSGPCEPSPQILGAPVSTLRPHVLDLTLSPTTSTPTSPRRRPCRLPCNPCGSPPPTLMYCPCP